MTTGEDTTQVPEGKITYGGKAVGLTFNPSGKSEVDNIK